MAIERAVEATDPRIRGVFAYQRKLRPAVLRAIDHVVSLVAALPEPVELSRKNYTLEPRVLAAFSSPSRITEVLQQDAALSELLSGGGVSGAIYTVLVMEKQEKNVFGIEMEDGMLRRDVAQVSVSFANHRLLDPTTSLDETQKRLRRRAFDHLLTVALRRIAACHEKRAELERMRSLLLRKHKVLQSGQWGFDPCQPQELVHDDEMAAQLQDIERQLSECTRDSDTLTVNLDILIDILSNADQQMWIDTKTLYVDRKGIKRAHENDSTLTLLLHEVGGSLGRTLILLPVIVQRDEIPAPKNFLTEAARYL